MKYSQLLQAIDSASQRLLGRAAAVVNQSLVIRNWLVGAYIVEFEQNGEDRGKYGERLHATLAEDLGRRGCKGCGERVLQQMVNIYRLYPQMASAIPQPVVAEFCNKLGSRKPADAATTGCGIEKALTPIPSPPVRESSIAVDGRQARDPVTTGDRISQPVVGQAPYHTADLIRDRSVLEFTCLADVREPIRRRAA